MGHEMTNNQTIGSVTREVLETALRDAQLVRFPTDKQVLELRALLDAHDALHAQPADATHYYPKVPCSRKWRKQIEGAWHEWCGGKWLPLDHAMADDYLPVALLEAGAAPCAKSQVEPADRLYGAHTAVGFLERMLKGSGDDRLAAWQGEMAMLLQHIAERPHGAPVIAGSVLDSYDYAIADLDPESACTYVSNGELAQLVAAVRTLQARYLTEPQPDSVLCSFYSVTDYPGLVHELVGHVAQLQELAKRNVKPWEDTFPPTLLPAYIERVIAANTALQPPAGPVPIGWKLVPINPTVEMLKAVDDEACDKYLARGRAISAWGLMLDAAPLPSILDLPYQLAHAVECELPERDLVGGHKLGGVHFPAPSRLVGAVAGAGDSVALEPAEPILVEAVAVTRASDEDGLYLDWLLEGGIAALELPGTYLLVAQGELTNDSGSGYVYRARNPEDDE